MFDKISLEDWRGLLAIVLVALVGFLAWIGEKELALFVLTGLVAVAVSYLFKKDDQKEG